MKKSKAPTQNKTMVVLVVAESNLDLVKLEQSQRSGFEGEALVGVSLLERDL